MGGNDPRTLVLVGKTGNGKSATGNSILGKKMFKSERNLTGVTNTCEMKTTVLEDSQLINVIDTPGLFDSSVDLETIGKEIVSCIKMAIDGIHAVLVVYSVCNRFSEEEKAALSMLQVFFGKNICDYMIVVFTGGDELEEDDKTFEDFLGNSPQALKEILSLCGDRYVLFDNRTKDKAKKSNQVQRLVSLVNEVVENNGGQPYADEIFTEMKNWTKHLHDQTEEEWLGRILEMVEIRFRKLEMNIKQELLEERDARKKAEEDINKLREELKEAKKQSSSRCVIL